MVTVTVYSKDRCVQCNATYRALTASEVDYGVVMVDQDGKALEYIKQLGYLQAPVVIVTENDVMKDHWGGFNPDKIKALA